ncbi:MAG TPA: preprotein translocase subunit SecG [Candidatus Limnocylindria bacterium]|nr:preprotein translocase subunit SecG [Candidatus Limnocylindria bacterium]
MSIYNYITIGSMALLTVLVLVQSRGASLGAGLGGSAEVNTVRRGSDKSLHQLTIIIALVFSGSIILGIVG